jgi:molybdopterin converting factor small subunit
MATVFLPKPLQDLTGGCGEVEVDGGVLRDVVEELDRRFPGIAERLVQGDTLSRGVAVSIDGDISRVGLRAKVAPDSEVRFVPAIRGGT